MSDDMLKYDYEEYRRCKARLVAAGRLPDNDTELAAIEREIGRAYIHLRGHSEIVEWCESRRAYEDVNVDKYHAAQAAEIQIEGELDELIARWRRLHAEGAE